MSSYSFNLSQAPNHGITVLPDVMTSPPTANQYLAVKQVLDGNVETAFVDPLTLSVTIADTSPANPVHGQLWFDSSSPELYVWYSDPNSSQWVIATGNAGGLTTDAPADGQIYGRQKGLWSSLGAGAPFLPLSGGNVTGSLGIGGSSGPTWTTGSGVPSSTQPVGSLYSRTGGAIGATLYVSRGGGTWAAVAGV